MGTSAVTPLELFFDNEKIKSCVNELVSQSSFFTASNQISLRHRANKAGQHPTELLKDGIGSLFDFSTQQWLGSESDFNQNNSLICGTYLESVFEKVKNSVSLPIGRFRIMRLAPKTCYSWHFDPDPYRLHIPVVTNEACFYLTKEGGMEQMLDMGRLYQVNTAVYHTALNCSNVARIHLVFSCWKPR